MFIILLEFRKLLNPLLQDCVRKRSHMFNGELNPLIETKIFQVCKLKYWLISSFIKTLYERNENENRYTEILLLSSVMYEMK